MSKKGLLRMYRRTKDCTAMMVYNDEVADYYMEFLEERGLHVPEDISLVSFDDAERSGFEYQYPAGDSGASKVSARTYHSKNIFCG